MPYVQHPVPPWTKRVCLKIMANVDTNPDMMRIATLTILTMIAIGMLGCTATPFDVTISNHTDEVVAFRTTNSVIDVQLYLPDGEGWVRSDSPDDCYRECSAPPGNSVCGQGGPAGPPYVLLPGDDVTQQFDGKGWIYKTDLSGECATYEAIRGTVRAELCFGTEPYTPVPEEPFVPEMSGVPEEWVVFEETNCVDVEFELPGTTAVTLDIVI